MRPEVIGDVKAGKADLGWAGSRAFDSVGVPAFDALHAPLLIDSYALEQKVLESPLVGRDARRAQAARRDRPRHPPGPAAKATRRLAAWSDPRTTAARRSRSRDHRLRGDTLRALGASAKDVPSGGKIDGFDGVEQQVSGDRGQRLRPVAKNLTANVNLWPRPAGPVHEQEGVRRAQRHPARRTPGGSARRACRPRSRTTARRRGRRRRSCAAESPRSSRPATADLAALRRAVQPVYDSLERDAETKARSSRSARCDPARLRAPTRRGAPTRRRRRVLRARPRQSTGSIA